MEQGRNTSLRLTSKTNKLIPRDISEALGKLPPQALDVEEAVLGALMLEKAAMQVALSASLKADHFYSDAHKEIYTACIDLFNSQHAVDMRTVVNQLRKNGKLEIVGGAYTIAELTAKVSSAANIEFHIRIVQEMSMKRELIRIASNIHHFAYEDTIDVFKLLDDSQHEMMMMDIARASQRKAISMKDLLIQTAMNLQAKTALNGVTGMPSGFIGLDRITNGWQRSDLILVAARPGQGKTAFMLSISRRASVEKPIAIFSLEMSATQLGERLVSADYSIENDKIRSGVLSQEEWMRITNDSSKLSQAKLWIDDTAAISIFELRSKCLRLKQEHDIQMIVIDYLQLMKGEQSGNREQEIASISRGLKNLAKELDIPVIALSQLSRAVEQRADKHPQLSDLRESGSLEMDADVVMFLYRPEYYKITVDAEGMPTQGVCEVDVAKHRSGGVGMVKIKFQKYFARFVDWDSELFTAEPSAPKISGKYEPKYDPSEARHKPDEEMPF